MITIRLLITRQCDYAIRIVRALANNEKLTVVEICDKENIPQPFAYKILKKLENGLIVRGYRGVNGGYQLIVSLDTVTIYDIYTLIEGEMYINECTQGEYSCPNNIDGKECEIHKQLRSVQEQLIQIMKGKILGEIIGVSESKDEKVLI